MKKPEKSTPKRKRGRPTDHVVVPPDKVEGVLDSWLGKKPKGEKPAQGPTVRSKKKPGSR